MTPEESRQSALRDLAAPQPMDADPVTKLTFLHRQEKAATRLTEMAKDQVRDQISTCRQAGVSWVEIGRVIGLTATGAMGRVKADPASSDAWPSIKERSAQTGAGRGEARSRRPMPPPPEGFIRISDLAKQLGVARTTIYARIERGDLEVKNIDGQNLVITSEIAIEQ